MSPFSHKLTTERLHDLVIRSMRGYVNWTSSDNTQHQNENTRAAHGHFTLAPGGKLFVFQAEDGYFHFYDTEQQLKLCTHGRRETHGNEVIQCME